MASSFGLKLYYSSNGTDYTELAEVIDGEFPTIDHKIFEDKHLGQSDRWIPKFGAFVDGGTVQFRVKFVKAKMTTLMGFAASTDPIGWRIIIPDGATENASSKAEFSAILQNLSMPFSEDGDRMITSFTLAVSGSVTFTAGT